jgi:lysophospholipase L1-like esterase
MVNSGLGANVISPRSAGYDHSGKPSAMERYGKHAVAYHPDLVILAYGVNDARAGTPVAQFLADLRHIVEDIQEKTGALILLSSTSFMTAFRRYSPFDHASIRIFESYNRGIKQVAEECDALYADIFSALAFAPWTVDPDGVHPNNLGHRLIADSVYSVLAANCSCLSQKAIELRKTFVPWQDGSTLPPIS